MNELEPYFRLDWLSGSVAAFVASYTVLTLVYSMGYMQGRHAQGRYYGYILLTCILSIAAAFADNLVLFVTCWGLLGLLLYLLTNLGESPGAAKTAKKTFIIIGGTDSLMILGLALAWSLGGRPSLFHLRMTALDIPIVSPAAVMAYLCLLSGALAKAGAMPFHTWVPDTAQDAPLPVAAFLPASLDKLLGIYLLVRLNVDIFVLTKGLYTFLMLLGSFTIVAAVMMALVQHDMRRLLGYHAVSQVGYMILGIGTGTPLGIAGGLFHMFNNTLYKSCLFFSGGAVTREARTDDLDELGGYAHAMPITYTTFLIAALAISGIPPLNGFVSKWMIYQSLAAIGRDGGWLWMLCLASALFGSVLTLASFMKLIHAIFLARPARKIEGNKETSLLLLAPHVILAGLCVLFGVFAFQIPLGGFIGPAVGMPIDYPGDWHTLAGALLLLAGFGAGAVLYVFGTALRTRTVEPFVGGEVLEKQPAMRMSGVEFYKTVEEAPLLHRTYRAASQKLFDLYELGSRATFGISRLFSEIHNGELPYYLAWCILGMVVLFFVLLGGSL
ncbi:MAG TPA: proton-conducting transporter membrane subunit [Candidatus Hydrogenedentes bacterium]|nr:proton-conducting transporter membrane subunit [Candidatus Hydrogenedentota bacterium]HQH53557.1 proton-conducting transporter membrane subunit [Candidatus Hydrogenedentota bacterium]